ncbi:MAG: hypothetical protein AB1641_13745 [Thermodesulfobacteriota bacterium]
MKIIPKAALIAAVIAAMLWCSGGPARAERMAAKVYPEDGEAYLITEIQALYSSDRHSFSVEYGGGRGRINFSEIKTIEFLKELDRNYDYLRWAEVVFRDGSREKVRLAREVLFGRTKHGAWSGGTESFRRIEFHEY